MTVLALEPDWDEWTTAPKNRLPAYPYINTPYGVWLTKLSSDLAQMQMWAEELKNEVIHEACMTQMIFFSMHR